MDRPSRKARHNARVRARLLAAATEILRDCGPGAASIDAICRGAGLTRGAFYTHFPSKAAILAEAGRADPPLLVLLRRRSAASPDALWLGLRHILLALLDRAENGSDGTAMFGRPPAQDPARPSGTEPDGVQAAILAEMARGAPVPPGHPALFQALAQCHGTLALACTLPNGLQRKRALAAGRAGLAALFDGLSRPSAKQLKPA